MKHNSQFLTGWRGALCCFLAAAVLPVAANDTNDPPAAPTPAPRSIFNQPTSPKDGRDPFFPASMRLFASAVVPTSKTKDLSSLIIRGKSGMPDHPLVIINDVTFAEGDDRDVITPDGRIHIHCLQIIGDLVVIEANGQRHQLRFGLKP
jgi:hypothetical protein